MNALPPDTQPILAAVCRSFGVTFSDLRSKKRVRHIAYARLYASMLLYQNTALTCVQIGQLFGGRDHTIVLHAKNTHARRLEKGPGYAVAVRRTDALLADLAENPEHLVEVPDTDAPLLNVEQVVAMAAKLHGVAPEDVFGTTRSPAEIAARQSAAAYLRDRHVMSFPGIAEALRRKTHSAVHRSYTRFLEDFPTPEARQEHLDHLEALAGIGTHDAEAIRGTRLAAGTAPPPVHLAEHDDVRRMVNAVDQAVRALDRMEQELGEIDSSANRDQRAPIAAVTEDARRARSWLVVGSTRLRPKEPDAAGGSLLAGGGDGFAKRKPGNRPTANGDHR